MVGLVSWLIYFIFIFLNFLTVTAHTFCIQLGLWQDYVFEVFCLKPESDG